MAGEGLARLVLPFHIGSLPAFLFDIAALNFAAHETKMRANTATSTPNRTMKNTNKTWQ